MIDAEVLSRALGELGHRDPSVRRLAAEALATGDERALYPLIKALRDANPGVQDAAMRSLIAIGGEITAYMTLPMLREDAYLRNTARIILKRIGQPAVPLMRPLLKDKDDDVRIFAVDLIADIQHCDYPEDLLHALTSDSNPNVRSSAVRAVSQIGYREALPALHAALEDDEWVCIAALEALAHFRDEHAIPPIASLLDNGSDVVRYAAIEALGRIGSEAAGQLLLTSLKTARGFDKSAIIKSLVRIGITPSMSDAFDQLIGLFVHGDADEKPIALQGLCNLGNPKAIFTLIDVAGGLDPGDPEHEELIAAVSAGLTRFGRCDEFLAVIESPTTRHLGKVLAINAVASMKWAAASSSLIKLMSGDLREVRRASVQALAQMAGDEAASTLRDSIEDRDGHVRRAAAEALGRIRDRSAFEPLFQQLRHERYRDVYRSIVRALMMIDEAALCARLAELTTVAREVVARHAADESTVLALSRDPEPAIRVAALVGLGKFDTPSAVARLMEALGDYDPESKKVAMTSLGTLGQGSDRIRLLLDDPDIWVRMTAASVLGETGQAWAETGEDADPFAAFGSP